MRRLAMIEWIKKTNTKIIKLRIKINRQGFSFTLGKTEGPALFSLIQGKHLDICQLESTQLGKSLSNSVKVGTGVIVYFIDPEMVDIGAGTELRDYSILEIGGRLEIGPDCVIGAYNWLQASGTVKFGKGVITGPHCSIISTSHERPTEESQVRHSPLEKGHVTIGDNCWLGAGVSVLEGVHIGSNVTIGAGSVVTESIPSNAIAFGTPCRVRATK